ncbi:unnamed protein product [Leuciscus chuanchicus]
MAITVRGKTDGILPADGQSLSDVGPVGRGPGALGAQSLLTTESKHWTDLLYQTFRPIPSRYNSG